MPPSFEVEALQTATHLVNVLPTKTIHFSMLHHALFGTPPMYNHLRVFGCKCYPILSATTSHKLAHRSTFYAFLGYSTYHKGYRCLYTISNSVIISHRVIFDESAFLFAEQSSLVTTAAFEFLDDLTNMVPTTIGSLLFPISSPGTAHGCIWPYAAQASLTMSSASPTGVPVLPCEALPATSSAAVSSFYGHT